MLLIKLKDIVMNNPIAQKSPIPKWICNFRRSYLKFTMLCLVMVNGFQVHASPEDWLVLESLPFTDVRTSHSFLAPLPCYGSVQLSLDQKGKAIVTAQMIISDKLGSYAQFKTIVLETGRNFVDCSDIGKSRSVKVTDTLTNNSCWAILKVEDKLMPTISCSNDTMLCTNDPFQVRYDALIDVYDNCDANPKISYGLTYQKLNCNPSFSSIMHVSYIVTDQYMNSASCSKDVYFQKIPLDSIVFPDNDTIYCQLSNQVTGEPMFQGNSINPLCDLLSSYNDDTIRVCGGMYKINRLWVVMDWCLRVSRMQRQEILVSDTTRPEITCPKDTILYTSGNTCSANYILPAASATDACSPGSQIIYFARIDLSSLAKPGNSITLNVGSHNIQYIAIDPCGNSDTCSFTVVVQDNAAPSIVCPPKLILSLGAGGIVKLNLAYLSKFVYYADNCGIDTALIRRMNVGCNRPMDTIFRDELEFCCDDFGHVEMIVLKVIDESGNANICMIEIEVQNKNSTIITCPANVTFNCSVDINDLNKTGKPVMTNICPNLVKTITYKDSNKLDSCKTGIIKRKFYINLPNGYTDSSCVQYITIKNPLTIPIIVWARDTMISACKSIHPDSIQSKPIVLNDSCNIMEFTYKDSMTVEPPDSCQKILRIWKSVPKCGIAQYKDTQVIKLQDFLPPLLKGPKDTFHCVDDTICNPFIVLQALQVTGCNTIKSIVNDYNNGGANASGIYSLGRHTVIFTVTDGCNHVVKDTVIVEVVDKIAPVIGCRTVLRLIQINDSAKVIARDLLLPNYKDNCTPSGKLKISFNPSDPNDSCRYVSCSMHKQFPDSLWPFIVFVKDESGNLAQCNARLDVDDPNGFCNNFTNNKLTISGLIRSTDKKPMSNVQVNEMIGHNISASNTEGEYKLDNIQQSSSIELLPNYNLNWLQNLSTLDIIRIQKHILGVDLFTDPYEWIAADINKDGKVSTIDITLLRKLLLGKIENVTGNTSWRFLPTDYVFKDLDYPLNDLLPETIQTNNIQHDMKADFVSIKVGDVSGAKGFQSEVLNQRIKYYALRTPDVELFEGYNNIISFQAEQDLTLEGFQLKIHFNPEIAQPDRIIEYVSTSEGEILSDEKVSIVGNEIFISFNSIYPNRIALGQKILSIVWNTNKNAKVSELITETAFEGNEIYCSAYSRYPLILHLQKSEEHSEEPSIDDFRQAPNPFNESFQFSFVSNTEVDALIYIYANDGKLVFSKKSAIQAGVNKIQINANQLSGPGIYYYKFVVGNFLKKGKLILSK